MPVDTNASDEELEQTANAALDRLFGPVDAASDGLIDPYGGPDGLDPEWDDEANGVEIGPDECNGPWEDWPPE